MKKKQRKVESKYPLRLICCSKNCLLMVPNSSGSSKNSTKKTILKHLSDFRWMLVQCRTIFLLVIRVAILSQPRRAGVGSTFLEKATWELANLTTFYHWLGVPVGKNPEIYWLEDSLNRWKPNLGALAIITRFCGTQT